jgi:hypothetical protein
MKNLRIDRRFDSFRSHKTEIPWGCFFLKGFYLLVEFLSLSLCFTIRHLDFKGGLFCLTFLQRRRLFWLIYVPVLAGGGYPISESLSNGSPTDQRTIMGVQIAWSLPSPCMLSLQKLAMNFLPNLVMFFHKAQECNILFNSPIWVPLP